MKSTVSKLLPLALVFALGVACNAVQKVSQGVADAGKPKTVKSPDGMFQVTVPGSWREDPQLHEEAEIEVSNRLGEMYLIVLTESKQDFADGLTLADFASMSRDHLTSNIQSPEASEPAPANVGGLPAMQYTMNGVVDNLKAAYVVTVVETPGHFHQLVSWTLRERLEKNEKTLREVAASFKQVSNTPANAGPPAPAAPNSNAR